LKVEFSYGKGVLTVNLPENSHVMESKGGDFIRTPYEEIQRAVRNPIGTKPLVEIVKSKKKIEDVCIVVSDHTRAVPNRIILPPFLTGVTKSRDFSRANNFPGCLGYAQADIPQGKGGIAGQGYRGKIPRD